MKSGDMADANASLVVRPYVRSDEDAVIALWAACALVVPWNDPAEDIGIKHSFQPELFFVGEEDGQIVASVMAGYDGHRGWINYLAVAPERRKHGLGRAIMAFAEEALRKLGCPKINLQVRAGNRAVIDFYERLGFHVEETVSLGKRLDGKSWNP